MRCTPKQLDLFGGAATSAAAGAAAVQEYDLVAEDLRQQALLQIRRDLLRRVQLRLLGAGLWGLPNIIRNPDGPWKEYRSGILNIQARLRCWPATYILRADADGVQRFTLRVRSGCDDNPAIPRASEAMAELAPVSITPWTGQSDEYEAS